jgi:hypothetical protein
LFGIILFTWYISKTTNKKECNCPQNDIQQNDIDNAFIMRPSEIFDKMFTKPDVWQGYDSANVLNKDI